VPPNNGSTTVDSPSSSEDTHNAALALPPRTHAALAGFEAVRNRGVPDFDRVRLPMHRSVVVTGGSGCIGTAVLQLLRHCGVPRLTSISRRPPAPHRRIPQVDYRLADVRNVVEVQQVIRAAQPELVIHLAGQRQPALAEQQVAETISANVFGTMAVLAAASRAGVTSVVTASTGKALRFYAPEVYAASKKLVEYLVSQAPGWWGLPCSAVRFTHVVDNSLIYGRLRQWAKLGQPIRLHAPGIGFYAQSAREAAQLLAIASREVHATPRLFALSDIGWPHDLFELARDVVADEASSSTISFSGYEPGYEDRLYPGTFDPLQSETSPLFNALEAGHAVAGLSSPFVETLPLQQDPDPVVDGALAVLERCWKNRADEDATREALHEASVTLMKRAFARSTAGELAAICKLSFGKVGEVPEHAFVHRHLLEAAKAAGAYSGRDPLLTRTDETADMNGGSSRCEA
jgi:nucleoside-diphosphate-sugar epimerase